jgi:predicted permease
MVSRRALVVMEVGIVVVLSIGAAVLVRRFVEMRNIDPGFDTERVLLVDMSAPAYQYPESVQISAFYRELCERVRAVPGVESVGVIRPVPLSTEDFGGESVEVAAERVGDVPEKGIDAELRFAGPGTFAALGTPLIDGREFEPRDSRDVLPTAIVNSALAQSLFPGEERVVGRKIEGLRGGIEIIGVVGNVRHHHPTEETKPAMYVSVEQITRRGMSLAIRTKVPPLEVASAVRQAIADVDPEQPIRTITTTGAVASSALSRERLSTSIISLFATIALFIAVIGVSGTLAFSVAQRVREIGVRMAIGARPMDIARLVLGEGLSLASAGVALGVVGAWSLSGTLAGVAPGTDATDVSTWAATVAAILISAALASWIPATRAAAVDPASAIRE